MQTSLLVTALLMGLAGGPHCIAMCGAACAGIGQAAAPHSTRAIGTFQLGRVIGYGALGGLAAATMQGLGWLTVQSAALRPVWTMVHVAAVLMGLALVVLAQQPVWLETGARRIWTKVRSATQSMGLAAPLALADDADSFFRAVKQDNAPAMRSLLERGVDPNIKDDKGSSGLHLALQDGALKVADVLLASPRLKAESRNAADESPLMMAALKGHLDIAARLIKLGADVNKPGWAPLHYAATGGHLKLMELLLEEHAFIDAESPNGTTPLMMAASYGTPEAVKLLIEAGADIHMRNQKGMTALDFARRAERPDSVELIETALKWARQKQQGPRGTW